jgi:hypothetical protein
VRKVCPSDYSTVTKVLLGDRAESIVQKTWGFRLFAEIPDPQCVNDAKPATHIDNFRQVLVARFGAPGKRTKRLAHPARITMRGIGFFDVDHGTERMERLLLI